MLLVFALAAAVCLQVFVRSDTVSGEGRSLCSAAYLCQSTAEVIRSRGGEPEAALREAAEELDCSFEDGTLYLELSGEWKPEEGGPCRLEAVRAESETEGLNTVLVTAERGGERVFEIRVVWQKEAVRRG